MVSASTSTDRKPGYVYGRAPCRFRSGAVGAEEREPVVHVVDEDQQDVGPPAGRTGTMTGTPRTSSTTVSMP